MHISPVKIIFQSFQRSANFQMSFYAHSSPPPLIFIHFPMRTFFFLVSVWAFLKNSHSALGIRRLGDFMIFKKSAVLMTKLCIVAASPGLLSSTHVSWSNVKSLFTPRTCCMTLVWLWTPQQRAANVTTGVSSLHSQVEDPELRNCQISDVNLVSLTNIRCSVVLNRKNIEFRRRRLCKYWLCKNLRLLLWFFFALFYSHSLFES